MGVEVNVKNFVNGDFVETPATIDSYNPATGKVWATIPDSDKTHVEQAVQAAAAAYPAWSKLSYEQRANFLFKIADGIDARREEFALMESRDQGKPVNLARKMDIPRASYNFRCFAESWQHLLQTANSQPGPGVINYSTRNPVGVAALISPWNLPLYLLSFKIAPAIMAGNTVVCKPSEMTSVTAWMLCQVCQEVGIPVGVVNMVFGYGRTAGEELVRHPKVKIVSFTGSTVVGQHIASVAAPAMKKLSLELGGKNAAVIFNDANIDEAVDVTTRSSMANQGEICLCTSRVFVQKEIYDTFLEKFVKSVKSLRVGDPEDESVFMGAINSKVHYDKVMSYIGLARKEGGVIHCGEGVTKLDLPSHNQGGFFIQPTVVTGLSDDARCMQEEIFGPVVCVTPFSTEEEVVERANNVKYGLCATVWSQNVGIIHRMGAALEVGTVWSNCWLIRSLDMPFGGCKESGSGREGTIHSLEAFTEEKTICVKIV